MHDRQKIIKEKLDEIVELTRGLNYVSFMTAVENANDILAMLKEQEPVEPRIQTGSGASWWYICGKCNAALNPKDAYCSRCGRKVKWDG